ncbi:MAG: hypothetical protein KDA96_28885, partial [Planctomycetaceae bacterium]|nr:hypothetical protein [Planctomycetaceae bacterium]
MNRFVRIVILTLCFSSTGGLLAEDQTAAEKIDFGRQIRPILSNACFQCHGPDEASRKGDLRLDIKAGIEEAPSGEQLIVPHQPEESSLLLRIISDEESEKMPPPKSGKVVKPEQIALIRKWIEQGGEYVDHWAFSPPAKGELPPV